MTAADAARAAPRRHQGARRSSAASTPSRSRPSRARRASRRPIVYGHFDDLAGLLEALVDREARRAARPARRGPAGGPRPRRTPVERARGRAGAATSRPSRADPATWRLVLMPPEGAPESCASGSPRGARGVVAQLAAAIGGGGRGRASPDPELTARTLSRALRRGGAPAAHGPRARTRPSGCWPTPGGPCGGWPEPGAPTGAHRARRGVASPPMSEGLGAVAGTTPPRSARSRRLVLTAMIFAVAMIVHRPDDRRAGDPQPAARPAPLRDRRAVDRQRLPAGAVGALRARRQGRRRRRATARRSWSASRLRGLLGALRRSPRPARGQAWMIVFRVLQGASAAFLFPAALAIVVAAYPVQRARQGAGDLLLVSGGLTAVGPLAGGYLTEWTWRAIFWINVPVAIIAIVLTLRRKPGEDRHPAPIDVRGAVLVMRRDGARGARAAAGQRWGWDSAATWACLVAGLALSRPSSASSCAPTSRSCRSGSSPTAASPSTTPCSSCCRLLRPAVLLREPLRAGRAGRERVERGAVPARLLRRLHDRRTARAGASSTAAGARPRWSRAARWRRSASSSGVASSTSCRSAPSGSTWRSPGPGSAWCSDR